MGACNIKARGLGGTKNGRNMAGAARLVDKEKAEPSQPSKMAREKNELRCPMKSLSSSLGNEYEALTRGGGGQMEREWHVEQTVS